MNEFWIKGNYPLGPFSTPPVNQAVADVLSNAPWAAWKTGRVAFTYEYVDRPEAGTAMLAMTNPPTRPTPTDGLRYMYGEGHEQRQVSTHTVSVPTSYQTPNQHTRIQVELECYTALAGHFPPLSSGQPLPADSPELRLTRYRKRWRITNGQYPGLWFYWWGRDDSGGIGNQPVRMAPAGWDRNPVRNYPLVKPPNVAAAPPIFPFPDPSKLPLQATPSQAGGGAGPATPQARPPAAVAPPNANPAHFAMQQQLAAGGNPYARQNLSQLGTPNQASMGASNPTLEARQAQFQAQQQAALAASQGRLPPAGQAAYGYTPQQVQALQAQQAYLAAQQQQQQQGTPTAARLQQQQQLQQQQLQQQQRKPPLPPSANPSASLAGTVPPSTTSTAPPVPPQFEDSSPLTDLLDVLTPRQLAVHRYSTQHDLLTPLFSPWTASEILAGAPRVREIDELADPLVNGISARTNEPRVGVVPGLGREGKLGMLANTADRIAVMGALGKGSEKATGGRSVEDRRKELEGMLRELEGETDELARKFGEQEAKLRRATAGEATVAA